MRKTVVNDQSIYTRFVNDNKPCPFKENNRKSSEMIYTRFQAINKMF